MKKSAAGIVMSLFLLFPALAPAQNWYLSTDLVGEGVVDIGAVDGDNVWAVAGDRAGEGRIYYYDGGGWSLQTALFPEGTSGTSELKAIEAVDSTHVWAGGENSARPLIYFFDGSDWTRLTEISGGLWLNDIFAVYTHVLYFTGHQISVSWDSGVNWSVDTEGAYFHFGIDGLDQGTQIWTVGGAYGARNQIFYYDGDWTVQTEVANWGTQTIQLWDVCVVTNGEIWAAGEPGHILLGDGSDWTVSTRVAGENFRTLAARDSSNVWAGTESGRIYRFDGSDWSLDTILSYGTILGLAAGADEVWAGNSSGEIYRFGPGTPTPVPTASPVPTTTPPPTVTPTPSAPPPTCTPEGYKTPTPTCTPPPTPDCGCLANDGSGDMYHWGEVITKSCTLTGDLEHYWTCFTVGASNITIDGNGYTINCLGRDPTYGSYGIYSSGHSVTIRNVKIQNFHWGILAVGPDGRIDISGCEIKNWWYGIELDNVGFSTLSGNYLESNGIRTGGAGIVLSGSGYNTIAWNILTGNGKGIWLNNSSNTNYIIENQVTSNNLDGILVEYSDDNVLDSNRFCSNAWTHRTDFEFSDIRVVSGTDNSGENNFCDSAYFYDDTGTTGCTFDCSYVAPASRPWNTDFSGDGTSDIAIFRQASGLWAVRGVTRAYFGAFDDSPVPADFDGNGTTDIAIFRPASGLWAVRGVTRAYFGTTGDQPLPRDYGGMGTGDIGIFRPASGLWAIRSLTRIYFGGSSDLPVPGYYDGHTAAAGIFRHASGLWAIRGVTRVYFGASGDTPVPGDYDGDGTWAPAIFRPASGLWAVRGGTRAYFGSTTDNPRPAGYRGDGTDAVGIFRPASGLWAVRGVTRAYFGGGDDIPVTR